MSRQSRDSEELLDLLIDRGLALRILVAWYTRSRLDLPNPNRCRQEEKKQGPSEDDARFGQRPAWGIHSPDASI